MLYLSIEREREKEREREGSNFTILKRLSREIFNLQFLRDCFGDFRPTVLKGLSREIFDLQFLKRLSREIFDLYSFIETAPRDF